MKKRILACLLALVMLIGVLPVMALAENNVVTPEGFAEAVKKAKDGDTITLGKGTYTLYGKDGIAGGKSLTFVGAGKERLFGILVQVRKMLVREMRILA